MKHFFRRNPLSIAGVSEEQAQTLYDSFNFGPELYQALPQKHKDSFMQSAEELLKDGSGENVLKFQKLVNNYNDALFNNLNGVEVPQGWTLGSNTWTEVEDCCAVERSVFKLMSNAQKADFINEVLELKINPFHIAEFQKHYNGVRDSILKDIKKKPEDNKTPIEKDVEKTPRPLRKASATYGRGEIGVTHMVTLSSILVIGAYGLYKLKSEN